MDHMVRLKEERMELCDRRFYDEEPTDENGKPLYERQFDYITWAKQNPDRDDEICKARKQNSEEYWKDIDEYRKRIGLE